MPHQEPTLFGRLASFDPSCRHMTFLSADNEALCALRDQGVDPATLEERQRTETRLNFAVRDTKLP